MQTQSPTQSTQDMKSQLTNKTSSIVSSAVAAAAPMATQLADSYEDIRGNAVEYYDFTMDYFKKHPGRCLATGALVGLAAGFLLRSRK